MGPKYFDKRVQSESIEIEAFCSTAE